MQQRPYAHILPTAGRKSAYILYGFRTKHKHALCKPEANDIVCVRRGCSRHSGGTKDVTRMCDVRSDGRRQMRSRNLHVLKLQTKRAGLTGNRGAWIPDGVIEVPVLSAANTLLSVFVLLMVDLLPKNGLSRGVQM